MVELEPESGFLTPSSRFISTPKLPCGIKFIEPSVFSHPVPPLANCRPVRDGLAQVRPALSGHEGQWGHRAGKS